jgi:hypothetical protein
MSTKNSNSIAGPSMPHLHHRMTSAPKELWQSPDLENLPALVHDLVYQHQQQFSAEIINPFRKQARQANWYAHCLLLVYFYADAEFRKTPLDAYQLVASLQEKAKELQSITEPQTYIDDVDHREEFIRLALAAVNRHPQGETPEQAADRLISCSSIERKRVLEAAKAAEERAAKIREALARQAAQEAANKMSRE